MNLNKNRKVILGLMFALVTINCIFLVRGNLELADQFNSFSDEFVSSEITLKYVTPDKLNEFKQDFSIYGYRLIATDLNPIDRDEEALLTLIQKRANYVDIILKLESSLFKFEDLAIYGELFVDLAGNEEFSYSIEDPHKGFFMNLDINNELSYIDLAFASGDSQYCYEGLVNKGFNSFDPYFTQEIKILQLNTITSSSQVPFSELVSKLKNIQRKSVVITQKESFNSSQTRGFIQFTDYGIAHEVADDSTVNLAEDLPDDYWEPYTEIDIGIYRRAPTESQIKSDLQFYNRDLIEGGHGYVHDIKAYAIYAHSNTGLNTAWFIRSYWVIDWWIFGHWVHEYIYPSEIEALWYHSYDPLNDIEVDVYPYDMIIHATVCFGYSGNSGIPSMAKAFVDHGAAAFVGATVDIPYAHNDEFTGDFWYSLSQSDETVYQATQSYISTHNYYDDYPTWPINYNIDWVYGTHIKIYGNTNTKLNN